MVEEGVKRNRNPVDYALLVNGKGITDEDATELPKDKKIVSVNKPKRGRPVKIKLRRSLPGILTENGEAGSSRPKRNLLRSIVLNRYEEGSAKIPMKPMRRPRMGPGRGRFRSRKEYSSSFPPVPVELTRENVEFCLPQEMIDESRRRREKQTEDEDQNMKFLLDAVRTLRRSNPTVFSHKFGALNHLFEEAPTTSTFTHAEIKSNEADSAVSVSSPDSRSAAVTKISQSDNPGASKFTDSEKVLDTQLVKRHRGRPKGSVGKSPQFVRPRGRPKGSKNLPKLILPSQLQKRNERKPLPDRKFGKPPSSMLGEDKPKKPPRSGRERATSGYYKALNSMALPADYRLNSGKDKDVLNTGDDVY